MRYGRPERRLSLEWNARLWYRSADNHQLRQDQASRRRDLPTSRMTPICGGRYLVIAHMAKWRLGA
jgi:hypothetical protein